MQIRLPSTSTISDYLPVNENVAGMAVLAGITALAVAIIFRSCSRENVRPIKVAPEPINNDAYTTALVKNQRPELSSTPTNDYLSKCAFSHLNILDPREEIKVYLSNPKRFDKAVIEFTILYLEVLSNIRYSFDIHPRFSIEGEEGKIGIEFEPKNQEAPKNTGGLLIRSNYDGTLLQQIEPVAHMFPHHKDLIVATVRHRYPNVAIDVEERSEYYKNLSNALSNLDTPTPQKCEFGPRQSLGV